ncbi:hypothetical protein BGZ58_010027 [Dissophora ornata]|nr:hypothetical protein BGZ58_010027 [Dissophora ornata]
MMYSSAKAKATTTTATPETTFGLASVLNFDSELDTTSSSEPALVPDLSSELTTATTPGLSLGSASVPAQSSEPASVPDLGSELAAVAIPGLPLGSASVPAQSPEPAAATIPAPTLDSTSVPARSSEPATTTTAAATKRKLIILCDGTWCGSETNTQTNIFLLAQMIMDGKDPVLASPYEDNNRGIQARYFRGCGLGGTFLDYLYNGATGCDIGTDCIDVYKYIVQNYSSSHEIWMFGLSRGAYTVRCVAGMINNCGIVDLNKHLYTPDEIDCLCDEVYKIYRSRSPEDHPDSTRIREFRDRASHKELTPIKFMGLLDTVGSLGVPKLDAGIGLNFPEFYDQKISRVVEKFAIYERWFPGCHYDIGRQRFRFLRNGVNLLERAMGRAFGPLMKVIEPNQVISDVVLKWMVECIKDHDPHSMVIQHIDKEIDLLINNMRQHSDGYVGDGDIYDNVLDYGPVGDLVQATASGLSYLRLRLDRLLPGFGIGSFIEDLFGLRIIISAITATRDRRIQDNEAILTLYDSHSTVLGDSLKDLGKITHKRYPSRTFESFGTYLKAVDRGLNVPPGPTQ